MSTMYDNEQVFQRTFDHDGLPEYLRQAQWAEFIKLKEIITELSGKLGRPLTVLDIGVGDGRVLKHLVPIKEVWDKVAQYDAIDNTQTCVDATAKFIEEANSSSKSSATLFDATKLTSLGKTYDLVITTWFTAGNFYPEGFDFEHYDSSQQLDLTQNAKFTEILSSAHNLLNPKGELVLGSVYIENDETRKKQESFYTYFGMKVITDERDPFTATKEGFWSQRFTLERIQSYLPSISKDRFSASPLDTYDFAMLVRIAKN